MSTDSSGLERRIADLIDMADQAGQGRLSWTDFTSSLVEVVPGSIGVFLRSSHHPLPDGFVQHGYDSGLVQSYNEHFGALNPWNSFWPRAKVGTVYCTSRTWPSKSFKNTEFYNDWLMKLDGRSEGIGIKLGGVGENMISIALNLPDRQLSSAEGIFEPVLSGISGALTRAVSLNLAFQDGLQSATAAAVLVDRDPDIAVVVDPLLNIIDANAAAETSFRLGRPVASRASKLFIVSDYALNWLKQATRTLMLRRSLDDHRLVAAMAGGVFRLSVFPLSHESPAASVIPFQRYLILLVVRELSSKAKIDTNLISKYFRLSPAEGRMCAALAAGLTLSDAAEQLGITRETARQRLKQIFYKTGVSRQVDLITLLLNTG